MALRRRARRVTFPDRVRLGFSVTVAIAFGVAVRFCFPFAEPVGVRIGVASAVPVTVA